MNIIITAKKNDSMVDVIFDRTTIKSLKFATIPELLRRLSLEICNDKGEDEFSKIFLSNYHRFMQARDLLAGLSNRFTMNLEFQQKCMILQVLYDWLNGEGLWPWHQTISGQDKKNLEKLIEITEIQNNDLSSRKKNILSQLQQYIKYLLQNKKQKLS